MRFDQLEFLKKSLERAAFAMHHVKSYVSDKEREKNEIKDGINKIEDALSSITSVGECFLGMLIDDMKAKEQDSWEQEVEELSGTLTRSKREEESWKQEYGYEYGRTKEENEAWVIPFCIEELLRINKKLREYTPSNPELAELTIQEIVCKLSIEMQIQNNVLMTALRHLMGEAPRTTVPIKDNNKVKETPIRRSIHFNYQETDGREPLRDIELFHSYQVDELTPEFYKEMQVKALSQLREMEAKAGRYEILIWHGKKIAGTDTGTLVLLRKEPS
jgi:hypothetical protein